MILIDLYKKLIGLLEEEVTIMAIQTFPKMIVKWANCIATLEGSPDPTNPGNLKYAQLTASWGALPGIKASDGGALAHFVSYQQGFNALCNFLMLGCQDELKSYHQARTLGDFTFIYTGKPKPALDYRPTLSKMLGVPLETDISTFLKPTI